MEAKVIVMLVVVVALIAHVALYRWVKFKIQEGVILQFLRDAAEEGAPDHRHATAIAVHTQLSAERVATVCARSKEIIADPEDGQSWRARN
jgi:hypothetical protein